MKALSEEQKKEASAVAEEKKEEDVEKATEAVKEKEEAEEEEIEVAEERIYTIPLRRAWIAPRGKRAPRAVRLVKAFVARHMKAEEELVMGDKINEAIWARSISKPPRKIQVRAVKDKEGKVYIYPVEKSK